MNVKRTLARATSAGVFGCGLALYAAQAGMLPGVDVDPTGATPEAEFSLGAVSIDTDEMSGTIAGFFPVANMYAGAEPALFVPDLFARMQRHVVPPRSGFAEAPVPDVLSLHAGGADAPTRLPPHRRPAMPIPAAFGTEPAAGASRGSLRPEPRPVPDAQVAFSPFGLPCGLEITAETAPAAMLAIGIAAPCHPGADIAILHGGLAFTVRADHVGIATLDLPAFETPATVTARLDDGLEAGTTRDVPDFDTVDRVALTWRGSLGLELHALEAGADWTSEGHLRPDHMRGPEALAAGDGFLTLLGDAGAADPAFAQVYTAPRGGIAGRNGVAIFVDAPVSEANCARRAEARMIRGAGLREETPLGFTYPGCDAAGETLVLQNLLRDPRLAAN
jgi:hypothetical protein